MMICFNFLIILNKLFMLTETQLTDAYLDELATEVENLKRKDDDELYRVIGHGLYDGGLAVSKTLSYPRFIQPRENLLKDGILSAEKSFEFVANVQPTTDAEAKKEGKSFMNKLKKAICTDSQIQNLLTGQATVKEYLRVGIPLLLTALGATVLSPWTLGVIVAVIALILKVGYTAYCDGFLPPAVPAPATESE
jgi:hypothetical protein